MIVDEEGYLVAANGAGVYSSVLLKDPSTGCNVTCTGATCCRMRASEFYDPLVRLAAAGLVGGPDGERRFDSWSDIPDFFNMTIKMYDTTHRVMVRLSLGRVMCLIVVLTMEYRRSGSCLARRMTSTGL